MGNDDWRGRGSTRAILLWDLLAIAFCKRWLAINGSPKATQPTLPISVGNQHKWDRLGPEKIIIMKSCVGAP